MGELFLRFVNLSISASWLVLAVVILRQLLKKGPKWLTPVLWGLVGLRLVMPFSIESVLSLIPSAETIPPEIIYASEPVIHSGIPFVNSAVNPIITDTFAPDATASANPLQIWVAVAAVVWVAGVAVMLIYTLASYLRLRWRMSTAVRLRDNIWQSENAASPFVLGLLRPRIYLPFGLPEGDVIHVIAHEQAHIRRRDHWIKPLGFLLLTLYWFNPVLWMAYVLLCRDIELACDERVVKELNREERAGYSQALLACSVPRRMISACPLAFGEVGVKDRIKNVLNYRKPAFWTIVAAVLACAVVAVCFLTDPRTEAEQPDEVVSGQLPNDGEPQSSVFLPEDPQVETPETDDILEAAIHAAILDFNGADQPDGLYNCEDHIILGTEVVSGTPPKDGGEHSRRVTVYALVLYQEFGFSGGTFHLVNGSHIPTALTFDVGATGKHTLFEYWIPEDGTDYAPSIRERFPDAIEEEAMATEKYILAQKQSCYAQAVAYGGVDTDSAVGHLLETIESEGMAISYTDYFLSFAEYRELTYYGAYTLRYCFERFLEGGQTGVYGYVMARACEEIMSGWGEALAVDTTSPLTGQAWFDAIKWNAEDLAERYTEEELALYYPGSRFLLSMLEDRFYVFHEAEGEVIDPTVILRTDGSFQFTFSAISSYFGHGYYRLEGNRLTLPTSDGEFVYVFDIVGDTLVFDGEASSDMTWFADIYDGAVFA